MIDGAPHRGWSRAWILLLLLATSAQAQQRREPRVGYLYPAGGRQGSVVLVSAGGQFLKEASAVRISGEGVNGRVLRVVPPLRGGDRKLLDELERRVRPGTDPSPPGPPPSDAPPVGASVMPGSPSTMTVATPADPATPMPAASTEGVAPAGIFRPPPPPDSVEAALLAFPVLRSLDQLESEELKYILKQFRRRNRRQQNAQIAETAILEVTIDPGAPTGDRELRLQTPAGFTAPITFQVGTRPEILEREPNDPEAPHTQLVTVPAVLNGQTLPGDVDAFRFAARRGSRLVIRVAARRLVPFLADAVPGWFQATLTLYDPEGREVAYSDDRGRDADPALGYTAPVDGEYRVEIKDALYRGRQDFVYRVTADASPAPASQTASAAAVTTGVAVVLNEEGLESEPDDRERGAMPSGGGLPLIRENEPNDSPDRAQEVVLPVEVVGEVGRRGDLDHFRFHGRSGDRIVAEVTARRLGSPLDSLLRLIDPGGTVVAWNDDQSGLDVGLATHRADSSILATLKEDGPYTVQVSDALRGGGPLDAYRLRVSAPRPDFTLFVTPSCLNVTPAPAVVLGAKVVRRDGFDGEIEIVPVGPSIGTLAGNRLPPGRDSVRMTWSMPPGSLDAPVPLHLQGRAWIGGAWVTRPAIPADEMTQAFLVRHLVPARELLVAGRPFRRMGPRVELSPAGTIRIATGGTVEMRVKVPPRPMLKDVRLGLSDPPKGLSLESLTVVPDGLSFILRAEAAVPPVGTRDNLIVDIYWDPPAKEGKPAQPRQSVSRGVLPAIPIEIIAGP